MRVHVLRYHENHLDIITCYHFNKLLLRCDGNYNNIQLMRFLIQAPGCQYK